MAANMSIVAIGCDYPSKLGNKHHYKDDQKDVLGKISGKISMKSTAWEIGLQTEKVKSEEQQAFFGFDLIWLAFNIVFFLPGKAWSTVNVVFLSSNNVFFFLKNALSPFDFVFFSSGNALLVLNFVFFTFDLIKPNVKKAFSRGMFEAFLQFLFHSWQAVQGCPRESQQQETLEMSQSGEGALHCLSTTSIAI
jgi:hypothetical protein